MVDEPLTAHVFSGKLASYANERCPSERRVTVSHLLATQGLHAGRRFCLRERTRIGRALDNEIVLVDHMVSRYHAEVVRQGVTFLIHDLGSKNGLLVNGVSAMEQPLQRGDAIQIGQAIFVFETPNETLGARFSNSNVHFESLSDSSARILEQPMTAATGGKDTTSFLTSLGRIFDCTADEMPEMLNVSLLRLLDLYGSSRGAILLKNSSGGATPLVAAAESGELHLGQESIQLVLNEGRTVLAAALTREGEEARARPGRAMIVPLLRRERIFGALYVARPEGKDFTAEEAGRLQALSSLISGAVQHAIQLDQTVLEGSSAQASPFIGVSGAAQSIREQIRRVALGDSTTLLTGETGCGKELVAKAIHAASLRAAGRFVAIDCSAIPASLMESELFGHEAGAFTGAERLKQGKVEMAEGGTLFLDEIGEMQLDLQPKLLRFIEERAFYRVGGLRLIQADVRIIAATNRKLEQAVAEGRFRQDLLFRLNVLPIPLPPLRERPEDIRPLVEYFAPRLAAHLGKPFLGLVDEAWNLLESYPWPGNVRELRHGLERALILSDDGILRPEHFQLTLPEVGHETMAEGLHTSSARAVGQAPAGRPKDAPPSMAEVEAEAIRRALRYAGGNKLRAAEVLQIHRNTLAKKILEYQIEI